MDFTKDIYINKDTIYEDSEIVILYKGFLFSNNLTEDVYVSYGYGDLWENKNEIKMKPSTFGYLATIQIGSGKELQFCFKNSAGCWDNNNNQNYILPIQESETVLSFEPIEKTEKEINLDIQENTESAKTNINTEEVLQSSIISSNPIELYQTIDLENTNAQAIPKNTIVTQINTDTNKEHTISETIIKPTQVEDTLEPFSKITEKAKQQSTTAFDEDKVSAGSIYVNSIIQPTPKVVEDIEEKSLTTQKEKLPITSSFMSIIFKNIKLAFSKLIKLIKTSFNFNQDEN